MKTAILTFALVMALATTASAQSVGGTYRVTGTNFDGSSYRGTATVSFISNDNCRIQWVTGSITSNGTCMRQGSTFAVGYVLRGVVGLVVYDIKSDGSIDGIWTMSDRPGHGTEMLTPTR